MLNPSLTSTHTTMMVKFWGPTDFFLTEHVCMSALAQTEVIPMDCQGFIRWPFRLQEKNIPGILGFCHINSMAYSGNSIKQKMFIPQFLGAFRSFKAPLPTDRNDTPINIIICSVHVCLIPFSSLGGTICSQSLCWLFNAHMSASSTAAVAGSTGALSGRSI